MHRTRKQASVKYPIPKKGTKYIARASSSLQDSIPVVIAVRDILKLANTTKEVKKMINEKLLKINGRVVEDFHESIKLFNIFEADKAYRLTLLPTGKFSFEETKDKERLCKVIGKQLLSGNTIQINLHDGSNVMSKDKINIGDTVYLDFSGKIKSHVVVEKGKSAFIIAGKYSGFEGKIESVKDKKVLVKFKEKSAELPLSEVVAL
jgi:small subunit ribosomal protein S4e